MNAYGQLIAKNVMVLWCVDCNHFKFIQKMTFDHNVRQKVLGIFVRFF